MTQLKNYISEKFMVWIYIVFYTGGLVLFILPATHDFFLWMTPIGLLLATLSVLLFHKQWNIKTILVFCMVFIISILIEIAGVATGKLFGTYSYLTSLGLKVAGVPLIIGVNWLILVYGSHAIMSKMTHKNLYRILGAAGCMVIYDLVMEYVAPLMKMWKFEQGYPSTGNFLMWFGMAIFFQMLFGIFKIQTNNKAARDLFIVQILFFTVIFIYYLI